MITQPSSSYESWLNRNEDELRFLAAETGADRELGFDFEDFAERLFDSAVVSGTQNGAEASPRSGPVPTSPESSGEFFSCSTCRDTWLVEVDTSNGGGHWEPCPDCDVPDSDLDFFARLAASLGPAATDPPGALLALRRELSGVFSSAELAAAARWRVLGGV
jgi:hypothetical protein